MFVKIIFNVNSVRRTYHGCRRCASWYCHVYAAQIKQFSPRGIFRRRMRSGTRLASHPITLWDGSVFLLLEQFYPGYYLASFAHSLRLVFVVPFFASLRHLCHEPVSTLLHVHISGRIGSCKNYNCIKDVSRPAHCSSIPRGIVPRRGISIDLAIDSLIEFAQPHRRYSKIYSSQ